MSKFLTVVIRPIGSKVLCSDFFLSPSFFPLSSLPRPLHPKASPQLLRLKAINEIACLRFHSGSSGRRKGGGGNKINVLEHNRDTMEGREGRRVGAKKKKRLSLLLLLKERERESLSLPGDPVSQWKGGGVGWLVGHVARFPGKD